MRPLTKRQREVFDFIAATLAAKGYAPTLGEMCEQFQLTSLATVHKHLVTLQDKGYIRRRWNHARAIEVVHDGKRCPTCGRALVTDVGAPLVADCAVDPGARA